VTSGDIRLKANGFGETRGTPWSRLPARPYAICRPIYCSTSNCLYVTSL